MNVRHDTQHPRMMAGQAHQTSEPERIVRALLADEPSLAEPPAVERFQPIEPAEQKPGDRRPVSLRKRIMGFRPTARQCAVLLFALVLFMMPGLVAGLALFALALGLITYVTLGPDRVTEMSGAYFANLRARDPDRAAALSARYNRAAGTLARVLPEGVGHALGLPDPDPTPEHPKMSQDPFDRLARDAAEREDPR